MTLMANYRRQDVTFVRGEGVWLESDSGERYLDFVAGVGVNALGHAHPRIVQAITRQAQALIHCSNLYFNAPQSELAERLCGLSGMSGAFFCNSGTEAVEAAIKLARKFWHHAGRADRTTILYATGSFHGRTLAALAATDSAKYREGYGDLPRGFERIDFNAVAGAKRICDDVAAVIVEPIQGESGIHEADPLWLKALRDRCTACGALLIFDEVQCGLGRCGELFAFRRSGVTPDVLVLAKHLGGGLPLGAVLASSRFASAFGPGDHGSTFGGNPIACAAALAFLDVMESEQLVSRARVIGGRLAAGLRAIAIRHPTVFGEVRCAGLMAAVDVRPPFTADDVVARSFAHQLLITSAGGNAIRLLTPFIIDEAELNEGLGLLALAAAEVRALGPADRMWDQRSVAIARPNTS